MSFKSLLMAWASLTLLASPPKGLTRFVNPFIGTGGHGHTYPGPSLPFGMIQPGPDTRLEGWDGCSGYHHDDRRIFGFSHTHLSGTGVSDYGDLLIMPTTGELRFHNGADGKPGYASTFRHELEAAHPGYYRVRLEDWGVSAELTATLRTALHRFKFPKGKPGQVVIDLVHRDEVLASSLRFVNDHEIEGLRRSRAWAQDQHFYFVMRFSKPFKTHGIALQDRVQRGMESAEGKGIKAFAGFGDEGGEVMVKVGISAVSIQGARKNLDAEQPRWDFENLRKSAEAAWEKELSAIQVEGGSADKRTIFYTALYHAFLNPNTFMDVDGQYRGRDLKIHRAEGFTYHSVFSLWDTFRALHPLLTLTHPQRSSDFVRTFLRQFQEGGRLPVWEFAGNETDCMIGYHAVPVIADAVMKGVSGLDEAGLELALEAMRHSAEEDRLGLKAYKEFGYVPADQEGESVSKTLEYAFDDWCIAQVALKLGKSEVAAHYLRRAQSYKQLFDPATGFMRARMEGQWFKPFNPSEVNFNYTEANAWQYSFFAPQDIDGLMRLHGGPEPFAKKLDDLFTAESNIAGTQQADITGMVGQYAQGNEPSHHMAYLYAFAGQPWKTQNMVRHLLDTMYKNDPDGLIGNEDCGQMSAWYVLSALGFYSVTPGSNQYVIGTPLFPKATLHLSSGKRFVIRAPKTSSKSCYIQGATLDQRPYEKAFLDHGAILRGGELRFTMSPSPNKAWAQKGLPRTAILGPLIIPAPFVASGDGSFKGATQVDLGDAEPSAEIHYSLDGRIPGADSPRYEGPISITRETRLQAIALMPGRAPSTILTAAFHPLPEGRSITLSARYSKQYSAGGDQALIDGLRGGGGWRQGRWQGYQGQDLEAVVDLGSVQELHRLGMGFMQDTRSWILMPKEVSFALSEDGKTFQELGLLSSGVDEHQMEMVTKDLAVDFTPRKARFIRIRVHHYGNLPSWHPGAGNPAFFFADEILVN